MLHLQDIWQAVIEGNAAMAETATKTALDNGVSATDILRQGLVPAMDVVGQRMKAGEYFIPEVLMSSQAFKAVSGILTPFLTEDARAPSAGTLVLGTVKGDLHDIGKYLVRIMLEGAGFEVIDLGVDVSAERFVEEVQQHNADILGLSALITTTMVGMGDVIAHLTESGWRERVKVIIGGAPVTQRFAEEIGADGYSPDAPGAVELARRLVANRAAQKEPHA